MGDWIVMLVFDLLIPFTMIGFGVCFIKSAPKEINMMFGYRTTMSMKNKDTWKFAHEYCGIICAIQLVFLLGSIFPTEAALKKTFDNNGNRK